jgi:hypothetical protein
MEMSIAGRIASTSERDRRMSIGIERVSSSEGAKSFSPPWWKRLTMFFIGKVSRFFLLLIIFGLSGASNASAQQYMLEIVTAIRNVSPLSFEVGEKSRQKITINFANSSMKTEFTTGTTSVVGIDLSSVRNDFHISGQSFVGNIASVTATGETASGVRIMPNINYTFTLKINKAQSKVWLSGCHNEFPSYTVIVNGKQVYDRTQTGTAVIGLLGTCDIVVNVDAAQI